MTDTTNWHWIKHVITCPPGCWDDTCLCQCHSHSELCWPGRPDPACVCQQDGLFEEEGDDEGISD